MLRRILSVKILTLLIVNIIGLASNMVMPLGFVVASSTSISVINPLTDDNNSLTDGVITIVEGLGAILYFDPSVAYALVGEIVTVSIAIADVTDLWAWQVGVNYDPTKVKFINARIPADSPFYGYQIGPVTDLKPDLAPGYILIGATYFDAEEGFTGTAVLVDLTFELTAIGASDVLLRLATTCWECILLDSGLNDIPFESSNGLLHALTHDVAVSEPLLYGYHRWGTVYIEVQVVNEGNFSETVKIHLNFSVKHWSSTNHEGTVNVNQERRIDLAAKTSAIVLFSLGSNGFHGYSQIQLRADQVLYELDLGDNTLTLDWWFSRPVCGAPALCI